MTPVLDIADAPEDDDERDCEYCHAPMVHKYGLLPNLLTGYPEEGGHWECHECGGVEE